MQEIPKTKFQTIPPRILLGPGPMMVPPRVLQAMVNPMIGYLDPDFISIMEEVCDLLKIVYSTKSATTMALSGTGSAGMEAGLNSILEPNDVVLMCIHGFFCERQFEMATRVGANVIPLRSDWGKPFPPDLLEKEIKKHKNVKLVTTVQAETSTGILQPLEDLSKIAKNHDALLMVDAVTSLGANPVEFDSIGIDYAYSATQKGLACPPGLSPAAISKNALDSIKNRTTKPSSWYLDLGLISDYWGEAHTYHHTAPVTMILALREALKIIVEEGLQNRYDRHNLNASALRSGLEALGLTVVSQNGYRLSQITPFTIPKNIDCVEGRKILLREFGIEIGRGLGEYAGKVWRVGLMGESSKPEYVLNLLAALEKLLPRYGNEIEPGSALSAASRVLSEN